LTGKNKEITKTLIAFLFRKKMCRFFILQENVWYFHCDLSKMRCGPDTAYSCKPWPLLSCNVLHFTVVLFQIANRNNVIDLPEFYLKTWISNAQEKFKSAHRHFAENICYSKSLRICD